MLHRDIGEAASLYLPLPRKIPAMMRRDHRCDLLNVSPHTFELSCGGNNAEKEQQMNSVNADRFLFVPLTTLNIFTNQLPSVLTPSSKKNIMISAVELADVEMGVFFLPLHRCNNCENVIRRNLAEFIFSCSLTE